MTPPSHLFRCKAEAAGGGGASSSFNDGRLGAGVSARGLALRVSLRRTCVHAAVHPGVSPPTQLWPLCGLFDYKDKSLNFVVFVFLLAASGGAPVAATQRARRFLALPADLCFGFFHVWLACAREGHPHCHPASQVSKNLPCIEIGKHSSKRREL